MTINWTLKNPIKHHNSPPSKKEKNLNPNNHKTLKNRSTKNFTWKVYSHFIRVMPRGLNLAWGSLCHSENIQVCIPKPVQSEEKKAPPASRSIGSPTFHVGSQYTERLSHLWKDVLGVCSRVWNWTQVISVPAKCLNHKTLPPFQYVSVESRPKSNFQPLIRSILQGCEVLCIRQASGSAAVSEDTFICKQKQSV